MAPLASIFQLIMYGFTFCIAMAEIVLCARAVSLWRSEYTMLYTPTIGGIVHGVIILLYIIAFFIMHRRNSLFVQTRTDLILSAVLIVSCIFVGLLCAFISFFPGLPLLINFIAEWIYVGTRKLPGKWSMSLFNLCPGHHNDFHRHSTAGTRTSRSDQDPYGSQTYLGRGPYEAMPSDNSLSSTKTRRSDNANRSGHSYQYPPTIGPQRPEQGALGV